MVNIRACCRTHILNNTADDRMPGHDANSGLHPHLRPASVATSMTTTARATGHSEAHYNFSTHLGATQRYKQSIMDLRQAIRPPMALRNEKPSTAGPFWHGDLTPPWDGRAHNNRNVFMPIDMQGPSLGTQA